MYIFIKNQYRLFEHIYNVGMHVVTSSYLYEDLNAIPWKKMISVYSNKLTYAENPTCNSNFIGQLDICVLSFWVSFKVYINFQNSGGGGGNV